MVWPTTRGSRPGDPHRYLLLCEIVTGLCNRQACPLANSRYATVRQDADTGVLYLYIKTIERAHLPSQLWEKIRLSGNYQKALAQLDEQLLYFPKFLAHKCKQRLTRLTQVAARMRRIAKEEERLGEKLVPRLSNKVRHRERARERKAEAAAKLERTVERELLERLRSGAYGDQPLNVSEAIWKKVLNGLERAGEGMRDKDRDKGIEEEEELEGEAEVEAEEEAEEEDDSLDGQVEYVSDFDESDEELADIEDWLGSDESGEDDDDEDSEDDSEDDGPKKSKKAGDKRKRGRVVRMKPKKQKVLEVEEEETAKQKLLAF